MLQHNKAAVIIGSNSLGAGCGYTNGGIKTTLKHIGLSVKMPDCTRFRTDGKNEVYGIKPDVKVRWKRKESMYTKGLKIIKSIEAYSKTQSLVK